MATSAGGDENLEIVFWWLGDDANASIEDELDAYLEPSAPPRRAPWPGRRRRSARTLTA